MSRKEIVDGIVGVVVMLLGLTVIVYGIPILAAAGGLLK